MVGRYGRGVSSELIALMDRADKSLKAKQQEDCVACRAQCIICYLEIAFYQLGNLINIKASQTMICAKNIFNFTVQLEHCLVQDMISTPAYKPPRNIGIVLS
jgi:hypothetical protein